MQPKIVFMGTPDFAVAGLEQLVSKKYNVVAVVTVPDKPAGRGYKLMESAVKKYAVQKKIPVMQPEKLKQQDFIQALKALEADLFVVVAFRKLPKIVWELPKLGTFNLHGSILPDYRGAAPINWAVINGEKETGVTTFFIDENIDTGDILLSSSLKINTNDSAGDVHDALMNLGADLTVQTIEHIINGNVKPIKQGNASTKIAPKIYRDTCKINWELSAEKIHNLVRGLSPFPGAFFEVKEGEKTFGIKLFKTAIDEEKLKIGEISTDQKSFLKVGTSTQSIAILELQYPGKKRLPIASFLAGKKLNNIKVII